MDPDVSKTCRHCRTTFGYVNVCPRCGAPAPDEPDPPSNKSPQFYSMVTVVWDTSALMSNDFEFLFDTLSRNAIANRINVRHILPIEVKLELRKHFDNPEKEQIARHARTALANHLVRAASYEEVDLAHVAIPADFDQILGPDSQTDKRILAFALSLLENTTVGVAIATKDGGIIYEIERRKRNGCRLKVLKSVEGIHEIFRLTKMA